MHDAIDSALLVCDKLNAGWGATHVISDVSFSLRTGETLALLGRNGVGKTTLLSSIAGRANIRSGSIELNGERIEALPTHIRAARGIGFVPQEREIFPSLSVEENLTIALRGPAVGAQGWTLKKVYDLFPRLNERRRIGGTKLSGGEQQMLSIGRALMGNPSLLLMDEPLEGLAPVVVDLILAAIRKIQLESTIAIVLIEQHIDIALELTNRLIVLDRGAVIFDGSDGCRTIDRGSIERLVGLDSIAVA